MTRHYTIEEKVLKPEEAIKSIYETNQKMLEMLENHFEKDALWKDRAEPVIQMGINVQGFGRVSLYILGFIASVSAGFYALTNFLKK